MEVVFLYFVFSGYSLVEGGFTDLWLKNLNEEAESQNRKVKKHKKDLNNKALQQAKQL